MHELIASIITVAIVGVGLWVVWLGIDRALTRLWFRITNGGGP